MHTTRIPIEYFVQVVEFFAPYEWQITFNRVSWTIGSTKSFGSFSFWITEAFWKAFQQCYHLRMSDIEKIFRVSSSPAVPALQINTTFFRSFFTSRFNFKRFIEVMLWPHVMFPHVIVTMLGFFLWLKSK